MKLVFELKCVVWYVLVCVVVVIVVVVLVVWV